MRYAALPCLLLLAAALVAGEVAPPADPAVPAVILLRELAGVEGRAEVVAGDAAAGLAADAEIGLRLGFSAAAQADGLKAGGIYRVHLKRLEEPPDTWEAVEPLVAFAADPDEPITRRLPDGESFQTSLEERLRGDRIVTGKSPLLDPKEPAPPTEPPGTGAPATAPPTAPPAADPDPVSIPIRVLKQGRRCLIAYEGTLAFGSGMIEDGDRLIAVTVKDVDGRFAVIECVETVVLPERTRLQQVPAP